MQWCDINCSRTSHIHTHTHMHIPIPMPQPLCHFAAPKENGLIVGHTTTFSPTAHSNRPNDCAPQQVCKGNKKSIGLKTAKKKEKKKYEIRSRGILIGRFSVTPKMLKILSRSFQGSQGYMWVNSLPRAQESQLPSTMSSLPLSSSNGCAARKPTFKAPSNPSLKSSWSRVGVAGKRQASWGPYSSD